MKCLIYFKLRDVSERMFLLFFLLLRYYNIGSYMFFDISDEARNRNGNCVGVCGMF